MGVDLLDVAFRVEKMFGISMAASDFEPLVRERDIVVGDLYELILRKIRVRDIVRTDVRLNFAVWEELRQQIGIATGVAANDVQLRTPLEEAVAVWQELRQILSNALGVDIEKVMLDSRLVADLARVEASQARHVTVTARHLAVWWQSPWD